jgi:hypothetical protein
MEFLEVIGKPK